MDENKQQLEDLTAAIHERMAALDAPVREILLSNEYVATLSEILNSHSLKKEDCIVVEEITTNFLLGSIRPNDLEQEFIEALSGLTKDNIRSIYNDIKTRILSKVWKIIENAWAEDDENEKFYNEVVEMEDVPLPPSVQTKDIQTFGQKINQEIKETDRLINMGVNPEIIIPVEKEIKLTPVQNWENKISQNTSESIKTESRSSSDRTLPKIGTKSTDPYREIPEE